MKPATKRCTRCGEEKELESGFAREARQSDGRRSECRVCAAKRLRDWKDRRKEKGRMLEMHEIPSVVEKWRQARA